MSVAIYRSTTRDWRIVDCQPPSQLFPYLPTAALCRTAVYCGAVSSPLNQFGVIAYDIQAEAWRKVLHNIPSPPDDSSDY